MDHVAWDVALGALVAQYAAVERVAQGLDQRELRAPSACLGWTTADLLFHQLLDAQRALVTFHSPAPPPPDTDFARYWRSFSSSDEQARAHERFVRLSVAAHRDDATLVARWRETARAAVHAARATRGEGCVTTQGHVLTTADFAATLVVESTIHHLDLVAHLEGKPAPTPEGLSLAVATIDELSGNERPEGWDDVTYILKVTGRAPVTDEDRAALGTIAERLPLFS